MTVRPGTRLGPYDILAPLGAGGMGEVYRARDTRLGRDVAIKVLPAQLIDSAEALARFEREARAVATLNHPNILALHDVGREGRIVYAVTELLEGETLRARVAAGALPPRRALDLIAQIARGLAAAHERGIVHRDIKPENLFLTTDGRVKILDFGVASQGDSAGAAEATTVALTQPGMLIGTPAYMAPEQLAGQPATPRSDLFALGLVAHEMLTGTHPFQRATPGETTLALLRDDPEPLGRAATTLPAGAAPILVRCLEKQPADRPSSARDLAFYLEALIAAPDMGGSAGGAQEGVAARIGRRVLVVSLALLLLVVLSTWGLAALTASRAAAAAVETDLARAGQLVSRVHQERLTRLAQSARSMASFPELKALFGTDAATVRDFLLTYQAILPGTPTLTALLPDGRVMARTDRAAAAGAGSEDDWVERILSADGGPAVVTMDGRLHHAAAAASDAGSTVFGYVVAATPIDQEFAQALRDATHDEIVLLAGDVVASTLRGASAPWRSLQEWRAAGGSPERVLDVTVGSRRFVAREIPLSASPEVSAIVTLSRDDAAAPYGGLQRSLAAVGVACAALAAAAALWLARDASHALAARDPGQRR